VYFNAGDEITEAAMCAQRLGLVDKVWGEMGHAGYLGADQKISSTDCGATAGEPNLSGHSDMGTPAKFVAWAPFVVQRIRAHLTN